MHIIERPLKLQCASGEVTVWLQILYIVQTQDITEKPKGFSAKLLFIMFCVGYKTIFFP